MPSLIHIILLLLLPYLPLLHGLSLRLIHRDSIQSPVYHEIKNLSYIERIRRNVEISKARILYLQSNMMKLNNNNNNKTTQPEGITPPISIQQFMYIVRTGIGTPKTDYYLILDTASNVVWTQCQPCTNCFPQLEPIFDPSKSSTYTLVPCSHPLCKGPNFACINDHNCYYKVTYAQPATTKGLLSSESFTFESSGGTGSEIVVSNMAFGCSTENTNFPFAEGNVISGLMGMARGPQSLVSQLGPSIANGRFSYCLVYSMWGEATENSYLRFGNDAVIGGQVQHTPFLRYGNADYYFLNLIDISIGNQRLGLPRGTFDFNPNDATGGTIMDTGSSLAFMLESVYNQIRGLLVQYYARYNLGPYDGTFLGLNLCYKFNPDNMNDFPSMTYHFQGADLEVLGNSLFLISNPDGFFCLGMVSSGSGRGMTIVSAKEQHNFRFLHDTNTDLLSFVREDCSRDT